LAGYGKSNGKSGQMGGVQEDAGGQLTCMLLRVNKREKTQVEMKSGAKGDIVLGRKSG
jgi:hypothetical protein